MKAVFFYTDNEGGEDSKPLRVEYIRMYTGLGVPKLCFIGVFASTRIMHEIAQLY